jgi:hypothetical protein
LLRVHSLFKKATEAKYRSDTQPPAFAVAARHIWNIRTPIGTVAWWESVEVMELVLLFIASN